jgi:hypothetical protein
MRISAYSNLEPRTFGIVWAQFVLSLGIHSDFLLVSKKTARISGMVKGTQTLAL